MCHHWPAFIKYHHLPCKQYSHLLNRDKAWKLHKSSCRMWDNPREMYQHWPINTGRWQRFLWQYLSRKLRATRQLINCVTSLSISAKMMVFIFEFLAGSWLSPSEPPYLHTKLKIITIIWNDASKLLCSLQIMAEQIFLTYLLEFF